MSNKSTIGWWLPALVVALALTVAYIGGTTAVTQLEKRRHCEQLFQEAVEQADQYRIQADDLRKAVAVHEHFSELLRDEISALKKERSELRQELEKRTSAN